MPTTEDTLLASAPPTMRFAVKTSLVMDLVWALLIHAGEPDPVHYPVRARRFRNDPDLEQRISEFWSDGDNCFTELFVLAERGGVLFDEHPDSVLAGIEAGAAAPPQFEPLYSETPADQVRFRHRLQRLHDEPDLRRRYLRLVRDVWSAVAAEWLDEGRAAIAANSWDLRHKLGSGATYADLEALVGCDFNGMLPRVARECADSGHEVVISPSWYGRKNFVVALRELLLVGPAVPPRPAGPTEETRQRARRLKALGDPTRLAIVEATACRSRTVGELAEEMGVAQPTISNHVKILREAGLLVQKKDGARRLEPNPDALRQLADDFLRATGCSQEVLQD